VDTVIPRWRRRLMVVYHSVIFTRSLNRTCLFRCNKCPAIDLLWCLVRVAILLVTGRIGSLTLRLPYPRTWIVPDDCLNRTVVQERTISGLTCRYLFDSA
jgi:hypothetical protein